MSLAEPPATSASEGTPTEEYGWGEDANLIRTVTRRSGHRVTTTVPAVVGRGDSDPYADFWQSWLAGQRQPETGSVSVRVADLFCGFGGLSLGVEEACRALGLSSTTTFAVDTNAHALAAFVGNFNPVSTHAAGIEEIVDGELGAPLTPVEEGLRRSLGEITLAVGGPPCQGHSDLNNHTRRRDPKNALYLRMVRFVEVMRPEHVIVENVPGVVHDRSHVVARATSLLTELGYHVTDGVLSADRLGWAQKRRRHLLIASRIHRDLDIKEIAAKHERGPLPVGWAIDGAPTGDDVMGTSARHSTRNKERIRYLFEHGLYELPDSERPDCHRLKPHSYKSVYGRMRPDEPAPTITSGFGSTGQGRFVHPTKERTLTPREAARVQGVPDWFDFGDDIGRRAAQEMIGNAVPSRLAYVAALEVLK